MEWVYYLKLTGLPANCTDSLIRCELLKQFPEIFTTCMIVKVWSCDNSPFAIVGGITICQSFLESLASQFSILGRQISFETDNGEARNLLGTVQVPIENFILSRLHLPVNGKVIIPLKFKLEKGIDSFGIPQCVYEKQISYANEQIYYQRLGAIDQGIGFYAWPILKYASVLDTIQALFRWNNQDVLSSSQPAKTIKIQLCSPNHDWLCDLNHEMGLGKNGWMEDFQLIQFDLGYVPFEKLNEGIVDADWYKSIESFCDACKRPYFILGVDKNLEWVAGRCVCSYEINANKSVSTVGKTLVGETFTRLVLTESNNSFRWFPLFTDN